jgi:type IV secretory pathway component VirB8
MAVKNLAFHFCSAILAVFVVLINWVSCCVLRLLAPVKAKSALAKNMIQRWVRARESGKL